MTLPAPKDQILAQMGELQVRVNDDGPAISGDKTLLMYDDEQFGTVRPSFLALSFLPEVVVGRSLLRHGP